MIDDTQLYLYGVQHLQDARQFMFVSNQYVNQDRRGVQFLRSGGFG